MNELKHHWQDEIEVPIFLFILSPLMQDLNVHCIKLIKIFNLYINALNFYKWYYQMLKDLSIPRQ